MPSLARLEQKKEAGLQARFLDRVAPIHHSLTLYSNRTNFQAPFFLENPLETGISTFVCYRETDLSASGFYRATPNGVLREKPNPYHIAKGKFKLTFSKTAIQ